MNRLLTVALWLSLSIAAAAQDNFKSAPAGSTPVPDPTVLTTRAQENAIAALKELLLVRIEAVERELKDQRMFLEQQDTRSVLRLDRIPADIDAKLGNLQRLMDEKFLGVGQQFAGRDVALAAALLAQKTSVDEQNKANAASSAKSENATTKQIDGITSIITASQKANADAVDAVKVLILAQKQAIDASIIDLKDRIASADARAAVAATANASRSEGSTSVVNIILIATSMLFALIGAIGAIFAMVRSQHIRVTS